MAIEWNLASREDRSAHHADLLVDLLGGGEKQKQDPENNECLLLSPLLDPSLYQM